MKTLLLAGKMECWIYEIPDNSFDKVKNSLAGFILFNRQMFGNIISIETQMNFIDQTFGFNRRKARIIDGTEFSYVICDEAQ